MTYFEGLPPEVKQVQATSLNKVERKKVEEPGSTAKTSATDKVNVSGKSKGFAELLGSVAAQPDVRAEKVEGLKQSIAEGTYNVDAEKLAEKIMDEIV